MCVGVRQSVCEAMLAQTDLMLLALRDNRRRRRMNLERRRSRKALLRQRPILEAIPVSIRPRDGAIVGS